ncbi:DUF4426 domain-containing protein [Psychromonas sp.]|uniref:DUF4426 domain-containing protein n=1 Tax=Psychromonas sp. TaxID=1884585 RepID=UPI0039E5C468
MGKFYQILCASILLCVSLPTIAEQFQDFGNLQVHYIALPSTFITPNIAKHYGIKRSKYTGVINITVLDKTAKLKAVSAELTGSGDNLLGQSQVLEFKTIVEGDAIYYIATYPFGNEEIVNFKIKINSQNKTNILKFQHKFYVD